ncbi:MAG: HDOD domain-containing protein [Betaproteobacteria bacterium]|nr:HDOD domain-containing protein [Betaproteobacteria bacterium]
MLERPFKDLNSWLAYFRTAEIPVLRRTREHLEALSQDMERVSAKALAQIVMHDPLLALRVLAYLEQKRRSSQITDVTTIERALIMLGVERFLQAFANLPTVENQLAAHPTALLGLLRLVARLRHASAWARDWALSRRDIEVDEVTLAALLHDTSELMLWAFAPNLALQLRQHQAAHPGMRSEAAQRAILGLSLHDLQLALSRSFHLPTLLIELMDGGHSDHPRVRNVACAVNLARHSANGWEDPALPDDYAEIENLLHVDHGTLMQRLGVPETDAPAIAES